MTGELEAGPTTMTHPNRGVRGAFAMLAAKRRQLRDHPPPIYARLAILIASFLLPIILYSSISGFAAYREAQT